MRKRLLTCLIFGATGLAAALPVGDYFGLNMIEALVGCSIAGIFVGYLVSIFLDLFFTNNTNQIEN